MDQPDVLSLYAHDSLFGSNRLSVDAVEEKRLKSSLCEIESDHGSIGENEISANDILSKNLSAAMIMGLSMPAEALAPVEGLPCPLCLPLLFFHFDISSIQRAFLMMAADIFLGNFQSVTELCITQTSIFFLLLYIKSLSYLSGCSPDKLAYCLYSWFITLLGGGKIITRKRSLDRMKVLTIFTLDL